MQPIPHLAAVIGLAALALPAARAQDLRNQDYRNQDYPNRSVTIVAPSAPGGMYSILARLIGGKLERLYGKSFIVENRPGASSVTGAVAVARSPPDEIKRFVQSEIVRLGDIVRKAGLAASE